MDKQINITDWRCSMKANEVNEKFNQAFDQIKLFYMFMYEDKEFMHFKHILYRDYIKIRKEEIKQ